MVTSESRWGPGQGWEVVPTFPSRVSFKRRARTPFRCSQPSSPSRLTSLSTGGRLFPSLSFLSLWAHLFLWIKRPYFSDDSWISVSRPDLSSESQSLMPDSYLIPHISMFQTYCICSEKPGVPQIWSHTIPLLLHLANSCATQVTHQGFILDCSFPHVQAISKSDQLCLQNPSIHSLLFPLLPS